MIPLNEHAATRFGGRLPSNHEWPSLAEVAVTVIAPQILDRDKHGEGVEPSPARER